MCARSLEGKARGGREVLMPAELLAEDRDMRTWGHEQEDIKFSLNIRQLSFGPLGIPPFIT